MSYHFSKTVKWDFETTIEKVVEKLKENGFGVLTDIDIQATLKKKIGVDFYKYRILGACHPQSAHKALLEEDKVGLMLPCNLIVQQKSSDALVEVSAVDPMASMQAIQNQNLGEVALEVQSILKSVIDTLG